MGFPFEHGLHSTLMAMRLGHLLGIDAETARQTYYACQLVYTGCTTAAALGLLGERFADVDQDGPKAYANFLTDTDGGGDEKARLRREAVASVRAFLGGFRDAAA